MREGRASTTARIVSFGRGVALRDRDRDRFARDLLGGPEGLALHALDRAGPLRGALREVARRLSLGLVDHVALRTLAIDSAVRDAVAAGARQCVLLGAGLDARAHRLDLSPRPSFFEVDHPATQAAKRAALAGRGDTAEVTFVPVDFARDDLETCLGDAGFDPGTPSVFVLEGVTMYLPHEATQATLGAVARLGAPGSRLAMTYLRRGSVVDTPVGQLGEKTLFAGLFGEPLVGAVAGDALARWLRDVGLEPLEDTSSRAWAAAHGLDRRVGPFGAERLIIAERRA